jgi:hypothetical protein
LAAAIHSGCSAMRWRSVSAGVVMEVTVPGGWRRRLKRDKAP